MRTSSQKPGKSELAYKIQPQDGKWVCALCGRKPVGPKDRKKGERRFELVSFDTKGQLESHVAQEHV